MADNNRGIHAASQAGDPAHMPDGAIPFNSIVVPKGEGLGRNIHDGRSRQELPVGGIDNCYSFNGLVGEKELLGQGTTEEGIKDNDYPSGIPDPSLPGASGTKNAGDQGHPIDFNSVAPYDYPEYPKDGYTAGGGRARIQDAAPLT